MVLFWRKGFAAASMNDLCDAMGVRSPSLYAAFGSKEALFLEALGRYVETIGPPVWGGLGEGKTARAGVENLLLAATESLPQSRAKPAGCMGALGAVCDEWPAGIAEAVRKVKKDNTFSFLGRRYETPVDLRDTEIQLRHDRRRSDSVMSAAVIIYHKGQRMGAARLLDAVANGLLRRKEQP